MKVIVWSSKGKCVSAYRRLMRGCDVLCLLDCGDWTIKDDARMIQPGLYRWQEEKEGFACDVLYCVEGVAMIVRNGWYDRAATVYNVHPNIKSLVGIKLKGDFWLFATKDTNKANSWPISEFYLREISDRFGKAVFVSAFGKKEHRLRKEVIGSLCRVSPPQGVQPETSNYLFTVRVACTDKYLIEGFDGFPNPPTLFEIDF